MLRGSRRSARDEVLETDPRFTQERQLGKISPAASNWGFKSVLLGDNPNDVQKLIRVENNAQLPWVVSVSSFYTPDPARAATTGLVAFGIFGTGSAANKVEFDARPDQVIQLPGGSVDLNIGWDKIYEGVAGNVTRLIIPTVQAATLPSRADVSAVACMGQQNRGKAIKTRFITTTVASNWLVDLPPYADEMFVSVPTDAGYANITSIEFIINNDPAVTAAIVAYSGAQLLALKNAGALVPVPPPATGIRYTSAGASLARVGFTLSL